MPFCPRCGAEYITGIARCADCGVALTAKRPPPRPSPRVRHIGRLRTIFRGVRPMSEALAELLRQRGIPCLVQGSQFSAEAFGGDPTTVQVAEDDWRAREEAIRACVAVVGPAGDPAEGPP